MREEDPSLTNVCQKRIFKLPVHPAEQDIFYFEKDGSGQKSQCATKEIEPSSRKAEPSYDHPYMFVVVLFQDQSWITLSFKA